MVLTNEATATGNRPVAWHRKASLPMRVQFTTTLPLRFWRKVYALENGCWEWMGARSTAGYGRILVGSRRDGSRKLIQAHRWAYEGLVGSIPAGLQSDHLCRNRACVNPAHIEPVSCRENLHRGIGHGAESHCPQGHPYSGVNLYINSKGGRICRI